MIRPSFSGILAVGALMLGAMLTAPATVDMAIASESARVTGHQDFLLISTDPESDGGGVIAAMGPIHAKGTDVVVNNRTDRFEFPDGNLIIKHKVKKHSGVQSSDPVACLFTFREKGTWKVGEGSTGAYANATGSGRYSVLGQGIGCDETKPPEVFYFTIRAGGTLSY